MPDILIEPWGDFVELEFLVLDDFVDDFKVLWVHADGNSVLKYDSLRDVDHAEKDKYIEYENEYPNVNVELIIPKKQVYGADEEVSDCCLL